MPAAPLPERFARFLALPNAAVVATVRADGTPVSAATWYAFDGERITLSMATGGDRLRRLRANPGFALTALAPDWYAHLSVTGRVVEILADPDLVHLDALARHYTGKIYGDREPSSTTVVGVIERWSTFGELPLPD